MKKFVLIVAAAAMLSGSHTLLAQRPLGDTIFGSDPTYYYYIYDWWKCANHIPEAPQWYTQSNLLEPLFGRAYATDDSVRACYTGPYRESLYPPTQSTGDWRSYSAGNSTTGVQMVTDRPLKIVGVAACGYAQKPRDTTIYGFRDELTSQNGPHLFPNMRDTTLAGRYTDSLMLLKSTANGPIYLDGKPWRVENAHRHLPLPMWIYSLGGGHHNL